MTVVFGTSDGVWQLDDGGAASRLGCAGKRISHVARRNSAVVAAAPQDGLYELGTEGERCLWQGDARACAVSPAGHLYVGTEPAMIHRSTNAGRTWQRLGHIDELPTRASWYFPAPPGAPHVRSIDSLPEAPDSVLAGVEVGGVLLSDDRGETWRELSTGVHTDVHAVRPDPSHPGRLLAVTGGGFYASEDGGASWEARMEGMALRYTVGLHVNPQRAGEVLVAAGTGPPGRAGRVYLSRDAGKRWREVEGAPLPTEHDRVPVVLFANGAAWIATERGQVFRAPEDSDSWSLAGEVPAAINAATADGCPSAVAGWR